MVAAEAVGDRALPLKYPAIVTPVSGSAGIGRALPPGWPHVRGEECRPKPNVSSMSPQSRAHGHAHRLVHDSFGTPVAREAAPDRPPAAP